MNEAIYSSFDNYLTQRLSNHVFTTEDSVRYSFFASLLKNTSLQPYDIVMEFPHNHRQNARVDTYIPNYEEKEVVIEFKYDRANPGGKNAPRPQKAGKHFNDMCRLLEFQTRLPALRFFIYLTDGEMTAYLSNGKNKLDTYFGLGTGEELKIGEDFLNNKCKTFQKSTGRMPNGIIKCVWKNRLPENHELRIYKMLSEYKYCQPAI
ncbi:hypothetical protein PDESU_06050 [Pontiella desulfatans]|uniref:Uncharacterized protein n=1 Tax=Pontiella desulfatans TaxID=2750659 RepID=A0A6C2UDK0_PONDE|nr:hypothetical protein [Pontiella desulfatans]VGO17454.1 hypothetical protein PDESU_06050 [Pontiella desulfatans]